MTLPTLIDDGTLDIVFQCPDCGQYERFNFDGFDYDGDYDEFVWDIAENFFDIHHECPEEDA
jgi:hypothetical protein